MNQQIIEIKSADILKQVSRFKREHARLVQILCTREEEGYELTYTFDKLPRSGLPFRHEYHGAVLVCFCMGK